MSRARQIGTAWETAIVNYLREHLTPHAERRALQGGKDKGDIAGIPGVVIEAKAGHRWELPAWWKETQIETTNANADHGALWIKRHGKASAQHGWVIMDGETYVKLLKEAGW